MNPLPSEDFTPYSDKDLQDLMRITQQTLDHYSRMLHSPTINPGYKHTIHFCYTQTERDLEDVKREVERRRRPVLAAEAAAAEAADVKIELEEAPLTKGSGALDSTSLSPLTQSQKENDNSDTNKASDSGQLVEADQASTDNS